MSEGQEALLRPVQREPVVRHVHRELRRAILGGHVAAGARLVETVLAERLGVSRTPVREAIQKLESEGLVRRLPHGGVVVEDSGSRQFEVILIRQAIEGVAARLACVRASDDELRTLRSRAEEGIAQVPLLDRGQRSELDREFHVLLARASHSTRLMRLSEEYYAYSWGELWEELPEQVDRDHSFRLHTQHVEIAEALGRRDAATAEQCVRRHFDAVQDILATTRTAVADRG